MTWSAGDTLRAVLLMATLTLLSVPYGPSLQELRKQPPSQRLSAVTLALRGIGALGFVAVTAWYVSALNWSQWVVAFAVAAAGLTLTGSVARYSLAKRIRASIGLPAASSGADEGSS